MSTFAVGATASALVFLAATSLAQAADCPLSISSLRLVAKDAHGGSVLYRLQLTAIDAEDRRATIDIETAGSRTTNTVLDKAAVAAAMRSAYAVTPAVDIYTVYYKFGAE